MEIEEVMLYLEEHGSEQTRRIYGNHGIPDPKYGVKVVDLKKLQKIIKKDYNLSLLLFDTGNYDAMYLAGLIADETKMTLKDLNHWVVNSQCESIACTTVAWITSESSFGVQLAREWIQSDIETIAAAGWSTYGSILATLPNEVIDMDEIRQYLDHIAKVIHDEREGVQYQMNLFVIAAGGYVPGLSKEAKELGDKIGKVTVAMGNTACKVPMIRHYIEKMESRGVKKRKQARC
ncbi:DNA alkylation repair protein [Clostridium estertheticum]|uniref:DNA alkylation repair protein n=1 Tax=Clostridium estertheticum TaxID=238834 RepID=UPI0019243094|nr:DNA alkylation repair protein [Clostridium estertheticum]MBZ9685505.1 DNA alkylation repair protein [Clostridium estertheticum]